MPIDSLPAGFLEPLREQHPMRFMVPTTSLVVVLCPKPGPAMAHVSERAVVLILPTDIYITFGVVAVAATVGLTNWFRALASGRR